MAILSALFGIGVGTFRSFSRPERVAADQVRDAMRAARLFARAEGVPATVVVRPEVGEIHALGTRSVGNWHFEDEDGTGWPVSAVYDVTSLTADGVIGWGLQLGGDQLLSIPGLPISFDSRHGFGVDLYVQPEAEGRPMTILERPGSWSLLLDEHDELAVILWLRPLDDGQGLHGGAGHVESSQVAVEYRQTISGARLSSRRPSRLGVVFDGRALRVTINGARAEDDTLFPVLRQLAVQHDAALGTGTLPNQFAGLMDELRVASVVMGKRSRVPDGTRLLGAEQLIHIDPHGHLDPAFHRTPVKVAVGWEADRQHVIEFGLLGTVRAWEEALDAAVVEPEAPAAEGLP